MPMKNADATAWSKRLLAAALARQPTQNSSSPGKVAYATMWYGAVTAPAFDGLLVLLQSIRTVDASTTILLLAPYNASDSAAVSTNLVRRLRRQFDPLTAARVPLWPASAIGSSAKSCVHLPSPSRTLFVKFSLWSLTDYDRLVFLDADTMVLRPLSDLLSLALLPHDAL